MATHHIQRTGFGILSAILLLTGCDKSVDDQAAQAAAKAKQAAAVPQAVSDPFVKAVQVTVGESPVQVRFQLPTAPTMGATIPLRVRLIGLANATGLKVTPMVHDHAQLVDASDWLLEALQAGQAQEHEFSLKVLASGIFVVDLAVEATRDSYTKTFAYAIPVAVPDPASATSAGSAASATK